MPPAPVAYIDLKIPDHIVQGIYDTIYDEYAPKQGQGKVQRSKGFVIDPNYRDCKIVDVHAQHWFVGMIWHHIMRTNQHNFQYDILSFDNDQIQFISYEQGGHYSWHLDDLGYIHENVIPKSLLKTENITEFQRKLSFSLLLNDNYEGGELQVLHQPKTLYRVPKQKGRLFIFDARCNHRVTKVKSGRRDVLVGWVVGPRWK